MLEPSQSLEATHNTSPARQLTQLHMYHTLQSSFPT